MHRPVVVFPLPDSPTRPNVSPGSIEKLTESTARTTDGRPHQPRLRLNSFTRFRTVSSGMTERKRSTKNGERRTGEASHHAVRPDVGDRGRLQLTLREGDRATGREGASSGQLGERGTAAGNGF